jgi:hypothetical protein
MRHGYLSTAAILSASTVMLLGSSGGSAEPRTRITKSVVAETGIHHVLFGVTGSADADQRDDQGPVE